jgi:hypothetical protein
MPTNLSQFGRLNTTDDVIDRVAAKPLCQRDRKRLTARVREDTGGEDPEPTYLAVVGATVLGLSGVVATLPSPGAFSAARPF